MAKAPTPATLRRKLKSRAKDIAQGCADDPFHGLGDFEPRDTRASAVARAICKLEGVKLKKPAPPKPKPARKAKPKAKPAPKPKKGKPVARAREVLIRSPRGEKQWVPLVAELTELLVDGWQILDGDVRASEAYAFLGMKPEAV